MTRGLPDSPAAPGFLRAAAPGLARAAASFSASLAAALVVTWPVAANLTTGVPLGVERSATVPVFNLWNLWWTSDRLPHGLAGFLDAPIFHPATGVTAYSEPMPLVGALVAPVWWLGGPPALAYNLALLLLLTLNGVFAYRLARALGAAPLPAVPTAVLTVTLPFGAAQIGLLPFLGFFGMLWTLEGLVRFGRSGSWGWAAWAAAGFAATFYTFQQHALVFAPVALLAGLVALGRRGFAPRAWAMLGAWTAVAALAVGQLALPSADVRSEAGFERPAELVEALSARLGDFLTRPDGALAPFPAGERSDLAGLFPGALLAALAIAGAAAGLRDRRLRPWTLALAAGALIAFLLALGLRLDLLGWHPFETLRELVPAIAQMRSPFRAAAVLQVLLAVLAGVGLARVAALPRRGPALAVALGLLASVENLAVPVHLVDVPASPRTEWTAWLRSQPDRVVVHVPFPDGFDVGDFEVETWRMFAQIDHGKPLVNGYSGYFPAVRAPDGTSVPAYTVFRIAMAREFPSYRMLCTLRLGPGAETLVADRAWLAEHGRELARYDDFLRPLYGDAHVRIYGLRTPVGECSQGP